MLTFWRRAAKHEDILPTTVIFTKLGNTQTSSGASLLSSIPSKGKKHDTRLFPDLPLYCEGDPKPLCRGVVHLLLSLLIPLGMWHLYGEAKDSIEGKIAGMVYLSCNLICYGSSALYHIGRWSVHTEILLQKLDHCGIALLSVGTMVPVCVLLLPFPVGFAFLLLSMSMCAVTCYFLLVLRKPSALRQVLVAACVIPFIPFLYDVMTPIEWACMWLCMASQFCGLLVYLYKCPDPAPFVFGSHEIFHIFVSIAGVCVYICNWSVIRRTCNFYDHHVDITQYVAHLVGWE